MNQATSLLQVNVSLLSFDQIESRLSSSLVTISEGALALLLQRTELPPLAKQGGILTPMSALGDVLIKRLEATGKFTFSSEVLLEEGKKTR